MAPSTTLPQLAALVAAARIFIGADTGPLHLACAVRGPVVGLFGPTDPARNGPWNRDDIVVRRAPSCAPCYKRDCATHEGIMSTIPLEDILQAVDRRRGNALARPPA